MNIIIGCRWLTIAKFKKKKTGCICCINNDTKTMYKTDENNQICTLNSELQGRLYTLQAVTQFTAF